jgi:NADH:ubiquinone oxidoreductase subunit 6 (subunit J)
VYAGAILVLFTFVIMFIEPAGERRRRGSSALVEVVGMPSACFFCF